MSFFAELKRRSVFKDDAQFESVLNDERIKWPVFVQSSPLSFTCAGTNQPCAMVATAAHLTDHVIPAVPVRQWVLSVPKRRR